MPLPNQDTTAVVTNNGLRTQYGVIIPPGAKVAAFVRSTGIQNDGADAYLVQNLVTTLAAGIARARAGFGDFVVVLPGHVETVGDATTFSNALVSGVKIVGVGRGSNMPTFNFIGNTSTWLVNKPDVLIAGIRMQATTNGNVNVGITVTGADFGFYNNEVMPGTGAGVFAQAIIQLQAGADRADISGNVVRGAQIAVLSPFVDIQAAVNDVRVADNEAIYGAGAAVGHIRVGVFAALGLRILRNTLYNTTAASTVCINFGAAANDGVCSGNVMGVLNNGTASAQGILFGAGSLVKAFQNFTSDEPQKSGVLAPGPVAT